MMRMMALDASVKDCCRFLFLSLHHQECWSQYTFLVSANVPLFFLLLLLFFLNSWKFTLHRLNSCVNWKKITPYPRKSMNRSSTARWHVFSESQKHNFLRKEFALGFPLFGTSKRLHNYYSIAKHQMKDRVSFNFFAKNLYKRCSIVKMRTEGSVRFRRGLEYTFNRA